MGKAEVRTRTIERDQVADLTRQPTFGILSLGATVLSEPDLSQDQGCSKRASSINGR